MTYLDALLKAKQAVSHLQAVKASLDYLTTYKEALERKAKALKSSVFEEETDVDSIKESKTYSLFLSLRGKLDERMEKEEAEALVVKLLFEQTKNELADICARIEAMSQELTALPGCEAEYERLYEQRRQTLIREGSDISRNIMALSQEVEHAEAANEQIIRALEAGRKVLNALEEAAEYLKNADECEPRTGLIEMALDIRESINDAAEKAFEAHKHFCEFKDQAANTPLSQDALAASGFIALDVLLNDMIAGRGAPDRVGKSKIRTETVISEMLCGVIKLEQMKEQAQSKYEELKAQLDALIFSPG